MKRETTITRNYIIHPEGSVLIESGNTKIICNASVIKGVPPFLKGSKKGWLTAEYSMLPRSTNTRTRRESQAGKIGGRTAEIQRLIGRSLRAVIDTTKFPDYTIQIDCDVIQADGGTRTAAITGACVALFDAFSFMISEKMITENPLIQFVAAISVGIIGDEKIVDLDYNADSNADVDMNIVMTENLKFVEIQGTAEKNPFSEEDLNQLLKMAKINIQELIKEQKKSLNL